MIRNRLWLLCLLVWLPVLLNAQNDAEDSSGQKKDIPSLPYVHQLRIGFDISRIAFNLMYPSKTAYEIQVDYALKGKSYIAWEGGLGSGKINYDNLKYTNSGFFMRLGIDQSLMDRLHTFDFDNAFIGVRYGAATGKRNEAEYYVPSPFGQGSSGTIPAQNYFVHWGEITAGIKVEFWNGFFAGWNLRGKFLINSGVFKELAPNYIPGYGKGDKSTVFDFNLYISYALRWDRDELKSQK